MITFKDEQKLINIRMQTIYFMLCEEERAQYKEMIEMMNGIKAFTLGLYEFKILTKLGGINSSLSEDVKAEIEANNIIVRLPNDISGNFIYAFNNIDLSDNRVIVEECLHNFVVELAKQSIALLKERQEANADGSELTSQLDKVVYSFQEGIKSGERSYTRRTTLQEIKEHRHTVGSGVSNFGSCVDTILSDDEKAVSGSIDTLCELNDTPELDLGKVFGCLRRHGIPESKQQLVARELTDIFTEMFGIPTKEESKAIAKGILNNNSDAIFLDNCVRNKPNEKPNLKIYVERIPYIDGRGNKMREKYGIRICVGSFEKKILFEEATQTMIYIAALLRHKMGRRLYVHELRNNSSGKAVDREVAKPWLKKIFTTIIKPESSEFERWIESISSAKNKGAKLNTATSSTKRIVKDNLDMYPDALYYCLLISVPHSEDGTYYTFNCSPDDIIVCGELQEAIRGVAGMY